MNTPVYCGVITNYVCTAACRHCMFASSPACPKEYITAEESEKLAWQLEKAGTASVHIGGGEPFMNFGALCTLIEALHRHGVEIDYIETNAFWCSEEAFVRARLEKLAAIGVKTIMVSVDPFHIEYVPLERVLLLCNLLNEYDFDYFIWKQQFLRSLLKLDKTKTHTKEELMEALGKDYVTDTAAEYGLGMNGRALAIAKDLYPLRPAEVWLTDEPCSTLPQPHHCHFDLYGNAIPSRCPGLSVNTEDYLHRNFVKEKYPVFTRLLAGGTKALWEYASAKGFAPAAEGYPTRCSLCYAMRSYLVKNGHVSADLSPACFYENMDKTLREGV